ncbi:uncharacterized protein CIMG_03346 [Coccidioides immitis RS]|uniref:Uncharacterized protein n=1 Tax=Coccidioides immitis (strain RS) TaxID=246410 RepID=A0A0E1S2R6_COCIM|nr:uncharacterized protein CIMG_03346 [Coccidioides immitis RS]EAS32322.2 hypothetical protein CIMG_03346 [Coccidioides immitis RS]
MAYTKMGINAYINACVNACVTTEKKSIIIEILEDGSDDTTVGGDYVFCHFYGLRL